MPRLLSIIGLLLFAQIPSSWSSDRSAAEDPQRITAVADALEEMLQESAYPYVVLEVVGTPYFVQFAAESRELFYFDLPAMVLDEAAQKRAKAFCAERGIALNSARAKDPSTNEVTILYSWQKFFDANETQAAASLALDAIGAIYDLDDAQLSILRAWQ